jgi:hypothetical protein
VEEPARLAELREESWQATSPEVRLFLGLLVAKVAVLKARLHQTSHNSSNPLLSELPSAPPRHIKALRGKPKTRGVQPRHADQQLDLSPADQVQQVAVLPTC